MANYQYQKKPVEGATLLGVEIQVQSYHCVQKPIAAMPFQMEDACRPDTVKETDVGAYHYEAKNQVEGGRVGQETQLDYRWADFCTPANQSIFRVHSVS